MKYLQSLRLICLDKGRFSPDRISISFALKSLTKINYTYANKHKYCMATAKNNICLSLKQHFTHGVFEQDQLIEKHIFNRLLTNS